MAKLFRPGKLSLILLAAAFTLCTGMVVPASAATLMSPIANAKNVRSKFDIKSQPAAMSINRAALAQLRKSDEMEFVLPDGSRPLVTFDRIEDHGGGIRSSVGYLKEFGKDYRVIITTGPGGTFGSIFTPDRVYRIVPGVDGQDLLVDMKEEQKFIPYIDLGNDVMRIPASNIAGKPANGTKTINEKLPVQPPESSIALATPTPQATVDLMVVYSTGLSTRLGAGLLTRLYNLVTAANTAYADSEVAITLRLVNATMVNYIDTDGDDVALNTITPAAGGGAGVFANIEAIRTAHGADMVSFLRTGQDFGGHGIAWLTDSPTPTAGYMYSVVTGCVVGCDSVFIHELGHNMGNAHDKATAAYQAGGVANPPAGAFSYSFGHFFCASSALSCNPNLPAASGGCATQPVCTTNSTNNVGTIMSYFNPVTLKFSNPNLQCAPGGGGGVSQPCGVANQEDNARSMNNMRVAVQNVKATVINNPPGALQFASSNFSATESSGTVTIVVQRLGGSTGAVSVNYSTQGGTATSGADFTAVTGTLSWPDGDATNKTFQVPLINDGITESSESFTVLLSNPVGATGIFLGNVSTATVNILPPETFPLDCISPAGWIKPATTPYTWTVATDRARTGSCSLKSDAMPNATQSGAANTNKAQISTTANFQAGTVSFYYNVSSEFQYDCLRFIIDTVQQAQMGSCPGNGGSGASGEISTWTQVSIPVSAGTHTFLWSYEKDEIVSNGSDAAWIDDVTLPPTVPVTLTISRIGTGSGTVTGTGINCGVDCTEDVQGGTVVALTATPAGGSSFTGWTGGGCTGNGACNVTVNAATTVTASFTQQQFTLSVNVTGSGAGSVSSSPAGINTGIGDNSEVFNNGSVVTLSATPQGGSSFAGWSGGGGCTGTAPCVVSVTATTSVTATFNVVQTAPGAPVIGTGTPGNTVATIAFTPPASNGNSAITAYTATCNPGTIAASGSASPITVPGLTNSVTYNCSVTATNAIGTSAPSSTVAVTPSAGAALTLVAVVSRKFHAGVPYNLPILAGIPIGSAVSVEPRNMGAAHSIVFQFNNTVTSTGTASVTGAATGTPTLTFSGNEVIVTLPGVADLQRVGITLTNVNGSYTTPQVNMGFMVGDITGNRAINASDISFVKAQVNKPLSQTNFMADLDATGTISQNEVNAVKARSGKILP